MAISTITVGGINPALNILGAKQQFNYSQELSGLQMTNSFIPTISVNSRFDIEHRNNMFSGFRWSHVTNDTDTHGSFTLSSFVNAESDGVGLLAFTETNQVVLLAQLVITQNISLNNKQIVDVAEPTLSTDAATKGYVDGQVVGDITLTSDITGTGAVGTTIVTTFREDPIFLGTDSLTIPVGTTAERSGSPTIGMIRYNTDLSNLEIYNDSIWKSMVSSITAGTALSGGVITDSGTIDVDITDSLNLQGNKIINLLTPTLGSDAVTKDYVDTTVGGSVTSITVGTGLDGGVITTVGTIDIADTTVVAGSYDYASLTVNAQGQLTNASSNPVGVQASFYMSNNASPTNLPVLDTFVKMAGSTTSMFLNNFTMPLNNRLLYTGTTTITALVSVTADLLADKNTVLVGIAVYKNGLLVQAPSYARTAGNNTLQTHSLAVPVQFTTNDYIEIFLSSVEDITTVTAAYINTVITL